MQPALDELWFDRYHAIKSSIGDAYEMLEPSPKIIEKRYDEFISSGYAANISLLSDRVLVDEYTKHQAELHRLRDDIARSETNVVVRDVYNDAISDLDATVQLIIAAASGNKNLYNKANKSLYDSPDENVFSAVCHWIRTDAENALLADSSVLGDYAARVLSLIPTTEGNQQLLIPSEATFKKVRESHNKKHGYYEMLFGNEGVPNVPYITQVEGDEICKRVLRNIGADWKVVPSENNLWAVMRSRKELVRPSGYRLDRDEFIGIICHEIGSHVLEEVNGAKLPLKLLAAGLSGFEKGNEGRAFLREQIVYDSERTFLNQFAWEYIVLLHLSVSLSFGLNKKPYSFSELYETVYALYLFWREKRMPGATNNESFAQLEAWYLAVRIMKGTDGKGGGYMKDSVYLEGNIRCWQLAQHDPGIILFGDNGMFDVTNPEHARLVQSLLKNNL